MNKFTKTKVLLFFIVIIAALLRLWQLGNVPPSPDWDEVALGYDAYSIIHTGRDEFGKFLPVVLRSFDDYKPALYAYLTIPPILIFGLNVFAVRLPSAIFGIISVIAVFYLVQDIFYKYKHKDYLALISAFLLAISPWSIQFSRLGFEANVGDALNLLMALFFIKGLKSHKLLFLSAFFAGMSIYVYQSEKVFTPLLVLALALIYRKELLRLSKKYIFAVIIFGLIVVSPMVLYIVQNRAALLRVTGTSIFSYQTELLKRDITKLEVDRARDDKIGLVLDNRRFVYIETIVSGYISHFDPNWLFISGDISRHHAPNMGLIYLFEFPFILLGIYFLLFGDFDKKTKLLVFSWMLLAPVPASITTGVPHAVRTLNFLPMWQIISAVGILSSIKLISSLKLKAYTLKIVYVAGVLYFMFSVLNFTYYLNQYFVQLNYYDAKDWQYGYKQAVDEVNSIGQKYQKVVVSDKQPMDKSYMFFLFYLKYPPSEYQKIGQGSSGSFVSHHYFGKYEFRPIDWEKDSKTSGVLYLGNPDEIPAGSAFKTIYNPDKSPAIRIAGT